MDAATLVNQVKGKAVAEAAETPKILDELAKNNAAKASTSSTRQQKNARRRIAVIVTLFLPVLAGVVFLAYQQRMLQTQLTAISQENLQLSNTLATQNSQLLELQQTQAEPTEVVRLDDSAVRELEAATTTEISQLRQQITQLRNRPQTPAAEIDLDWKLREAEYLVGLANQKLLMENDTVSAIALLQSADVALVASANSQVFDTRQALASELLQLRAVTAVDLQGIYVRIGNLAVQMDAVELLNSRRTSFENREQPVQIGTQTAGWLDSSLDFLSSVFVWRELQESASAMTAPGQESAIRQNLRLMLEQAQLALLLRDTKLYQASLQKSQEWIVSYAVTDGASGQVLLDQLAQLLAIDIDPPLPPLSASLSLLRQLNASVSDL